MRARVRLTLVRVNERPGVHPFMRETNVSGIYPPLGVAYLAAAARQAGFAVSIIDAHAQNLSLDSLAEVLSRIGPQVVGISSTTFNWPVVAGLARRLRREQPGVRIWVGGPQLVLYGEACLQERAVDAAVLGEGETALVELLSRLAADEDLAGAPGTLVRTGGEVVRGPAAEPITDLDSLPLPALDLLPLGQYRSLTLPVPFVSMVTTRGCPFNCRFCSQVYVGGRYREHGTERVLQEMERAKKELGAREIVFFDETFTLNRRRVLAICQGVLRHCLKVRFNIRTRGDLLDDELLLALRDAGCSSIHVGIEAGSARVRELMQKRLDLDRTLGALREAKRLGMETRGYFMIGYPGETEEEIEQTLRLSCELPLDWASYTITTPAPGTDIYREALAAGRFERDYWLDYTLGQVSDPPGYFTSEGLDAPRLEWLCREAYLRFYLRPALLRKKMTSARLWQKLPSILRTTAEIALPRRQR